MFFLWVFVVHLPRVAASPHDGKEWTSALVALAMCGGAWLMSSGCGLGKEALGLIERVDDPFSFVP